MKIRPESQLQFGREIEIGEPSFDSAFFIEGPAGLVLALLDAETRRLLSRLNAVSRLDLSWGELRTDVPGGEIAGVAGRLSLAQAEAGQLSLASDPAGQLSISGEAPEPEP